MSWPRVPLVGLARMVGGGTPSKKNDAFWSGGTIPWVSPKDMGRRELNDTEDHITETAVDRSATQVVPSGSVLVVVRSGILIRRFPVAIARVPVALNQDMKALLPSKDLLPEFLAYAFEAQADYILSACVKRGATVHSIDIGKFSQLRIPVPPLSEQRRIVEILDQGDTLRKKRAEADARATRILPALFYKMFGDPATNPMRWPVRTLGEITIGKPQYGANARAVEWSEGDPRYVRITDITDDGRLLKSGIVSIDLPDWEPYRLSPGDLLFARSGNTVGKTFLYREEDGLCVYAGYLIRLKVDPDQIESWYLFALTQTGYYKSWVEARKRVAGQPNINAREYASLQMPCPPITIQRQFAQMVGQLVVVRNNRLASAERLNQLFTILLHRAFTGDLTAKWREAHTKELLAEMEERANDLRHSRPTYLKTQADMERLNRSVKPSYLSVSKQMERALEPTWHHQLELARSMEFSGIVSTYLTEIAKANDCWQGLVNNIAASSCVFENLACTHQSWLDRIKPTADIMAQLQDAAKVSLGDIANRMTVTERLFAGIDLEAVRRANSLPGPAIMTLENAICDVMFTYERLAASIKTLPDLMHLPTVAIPGATREVFLTGYVLELISAPDKPESDREVSEVQLITEAEQATSCCIRLLQAVDPALARPYVGAHDAFRSISNDRARHILSSLRELWNHLLRRLAPDEEVISWVHGDDQELLHEGRPTRRARVLYVCRNLDHDPLTDFIVQDTRALVKLVEFFNRVHELEPELTDEQLRALLLRTDSWLTYILRIWEGTRSPC